MTNAHQNRYRLAFALLAGILFGAGLALSQMINPAKVLAFLDVAGNWDATLAFVMGGALAVTVPAFRFALRRPRPWFDERFSLPTRSDIDPRLLAGGALFGIGWGLAGFCPGPALTALVTGDTRVVVFVAALVAGVLLHRVLERG